MIPMRLTALAPAHIVGKDAKLITVEKVTRTTRATDSVEEKIVDLGFVGQPKTIDPKLIQALIHADEDYVPVVKQTFEMLADSGMKHLAPHALTALNNNYIKPSKRIFDNAKVTARSNVVSPAGGSGIRRRMSSFRATTSFLRLATSRLANV